MSTAISIVLMPFESVCAVVFFDTFLRRSSDVNRRGQISCLMVFGMTAIGTILAFTIGLVPAGLQFGVKILVTALMYFLVLVLFYNGKVYVKMIAGFVYVSILYLIDFVILLLAHSTFAAPSLGALDSVQGVLVTSMMCKSILLMVVMLIRVSITVNRQPVREKNTIGMLIWLIFPLVSFISLLILWQSMNATVSGTVVIGLGFLWLSSAFIYYALSHHHAKIATMSRHSSWMSSTVKNELQNLETCSFERDRLVHDFDNHLATVIALLKENKTDKAREYAVSISEALEKDTSYVCTDNDIVDAILNSKHILAASRDIFLDMRVSRLGDVPVSDHDIVAIIANLIDNAIEATEKVSSSRIVQFKMVREPHNLIISVKNPVAEPIQKHGYRLATSKPDPESHGIGTRSILEALDKYNASHSIRSANGFFQFSILFTLI